MRVSVLNSWLQSRKSTRRRRRARLGFESLEKRNLLATLITVNSVEDGLREDSVITLREAVRFANGDFGLDGFTNDELKQVRSGVASDFDVIIRLDAATYSVAAALGPIRISKSVSIEGVVGTTISPREPDQSLANASLFLVNSTANARLSNLKLQNARALSISPSEEFETHGAAVYNRGTLALESVQLSNNISLVGGAIANDSGGKLTLVNSSITNSSASVFTFLPLGTAIVPRGGGLFNEGTATVINSTISGNVAFVNPQVVVLSATETQNAGSGIHNVGDLTVINSTVANNIGLGGGISSPDNDLARLPRLYNTIVVNNTLSLSDPTLNDVNGFFDTESRNNIISQPGATPAGLVTGRNILRAFMLPGDEFEPGDVIDLAVKDNGGPTLTHALKPGSLAIDGGSNVHATTLGNDGVPGTGDAGESRISFDQRGLGRNFGGTVDIGAFEFLPDEIIVDSLADGIDGDLGPNQLTLREALKITDVSPNSKSIRIVAEGTLKLTEGELRLNYQHENEARIIRGPGRPQFIIDADAKSRLINASNIGRKPRQSLTIENLTLTNGKARSEAGIFAGSNQPGLFSKTTLRNVSLSQSTSEFLSVILADNLRLIDSEIGENLVTGGELADVSGRLVRSFQDLDVTGSTFRENKITTIGSTNTILTAAGDLKVSNSTFLINGTSGFSTSLIVGDKSVSIDSSTFVSNFSAPSANNVIPPLLRSNDRSKDIRPLFVTNSLFADNYQQAEFIGKNGNESISQSLLVLGNHGGPTETFRVSDAESIVGKINRNAGAVDQRGFSRGPNSTAGAFEPALTVGGFFPTSTILVTTLVDEDNGTANPVVGSGTSLREAISLANSVSVITTIEFAPSVVGKIDLTLGELSITSLIGLSVLGPGADLLTIDAGGFGRIFHVHENSTAQISGLKLTGGNLTGFEGGGAIRNQGNAVLQRLEITNNASINGAGGLANLGIATLDQVSIHGNTSSFGGGGIGNAGNLTVRHSTIARNNAAVFGGGIDNVGTALIVNSTIAGNTASVGGGVLTDENEANASTRIVNSIVIGNSALGTPNDLGGKAVLSDSTNNLIGDVNTAGGLTGGNNGNIVGVSLTDVLQTTGDEVVLVARGGTSSISVLPGSVVVDAGDTALANSLGADVSSSVGQDQSRRPRVVGAAVDIGALELALTLVAPQQSKSATPTLAVMVEASLFALGQEVLIDIDRNNDGDFLDTDEAGAATIEMQSTLGKVALPSLNNGTVGVRARVVGGGGADTVSTTQLIAIDTSASGSSYVATPLTVATVLSELSGAGDTLLLRGGIYSGQTVTTTTTFKPFGDGPVVIQGASPALTVTAAQVVVENGITLTNDTDAPTVVVEDGSSLTLRGTTVLESSTGNQPAILVKAGGELHLFSDNVDNSNTIVIRGEGSFIENQSTQEIIGVDSTLKRDDVILTDGFAIEDLTRHGLDNAGSGLVFWSFDGVFVTPNSGSIMRAIDAVSSGGLINIQGGRYEEDIDTRDKAVALFIGSELERRVTVKGNIAFDGNDTLVIRADGLDPLTQYSNLVVEGGSITAGSSDDPTRVEFNLNFGAVPNDAFTIIHADQGFTGEFDVRLNFDGFLPLAADQTANGAAAQLVVTTLAPEVSLQVSDSSVAEAGGTSTITATLSAATNVDVSIELALIGSADENEDFTLDTRTIIIPAGETSGSVTFTAAQDELDEDDESVNVTLFELTNAADANPQDIGIGILDDDASPTVTFTRDPASINENGGTSTLTATLSAPSGRDITLELDISGTAAAGDDYLPLGTSFVIAAGETTGTITVTGVDDALNENDETVVVKLSSGTNVTIAAEQQAVVTITDDDAQPTLSINDVTIIESSTGTADAVFTVTLSSASGRPVNVTFTTTDGSAIQPADYTSTSGTLTFEPGQTSKTIAVPVAGDLVDEVEESFEVRLSAPVNATIADGVGVGTITDDDEPPTVTLTLDSDSITEAGGMSIVTATLSAVSSLPVTIDLNFGGTATLASDYTRTATQIVIAAGETSGSITLTAVEDALDEADEAIIVDIASVTNATEATDQQVTVTVSDNDLVPTLSMSDVTVTEGNSGTANAVFTVTLSAASVRAVTVNFATADATATQPGDYVSNSGTLTFEPGETSKTITIAVAGDTLDEVNETFNVNLTAPVNATIGDGVGVGTITDDDEPPTVTLSLDSNSIMEAGGTSIVTATLSSVSSLPVTIDLSFGGTATLTSDYSRTATQIVIAAGQTTGSLTVIAVQDVQNEPDETIIVDVTSVTNGTEATPQQVTVTISDDDVSLDFGDASEDYPVTLDQNGARHIVGALFLGSGVDSETDGTPSANADSDGDDDGVALLATLINTNVATISSFSVIASRPGKLDAWIDFNNDDDWNDAGEQIFTSADVVAGENLLNFSVPAGSTSGSTGARFRLSSAGGLVPTGAVADGEVEDYMVLLVDGTTSPTVNLRSLNATSVLTIGANTLQLVSAGFLEFQSPSSSVGTIRYQPLSDRSETIRIELDNDSETTSEEIFFRSFAANSTIQLTGANASIDLTNSQTEGGNASILLDLSDASTTTAQIDAALVSKWSSPVEPMQLKLGGGDRVVFSESTNWRMGAPTGTGNDFRLTAQTIRGTSANLVINTTRPWQNIIDVHDVTNDGIVDARDALRIINELNNQQFSNGTTQVLFDPSSVGDWPDSYYDVTGDGSVQALDALRIINELNRRDSNGEPNSVADVAMLAGVDSIASERTKSASTPIQSVPAVLEVTKKFSQSADTANSVRLSFSLHPFTDDSEDEDDKYNILDEYFASLLT